VTEAALLLALPKTELKEEALDSAAAEAGSIEEKEVTVVSTEVVAVAVVVAETVTDSVSADAAEEVIWGTAVVGPP
jgi:hypothetical protein